MRTVSNGIWVTLEDSLNMSPTDGPMTSEGMRLPGVEWILSDLIRVSDTELRVFLQALQQQGFTEVMLQNPSTGERKATSLDAIVSYLLERLS